MKKVVKKVPRDGEVVGYEPAPARDMTLSDMIAWMRGCAKSATCEDRRIQAEIRRNYGQIVEALKWAKDHGCPVGVVCTKARGPSPAPNVPAKGKGVKCPKCGGKARPASGMGGTYSWCDKCGFQRPEDQ